MKRVVIPVDENNILDIHFGHCKYFIFAEIKDGSIVKVDKITAPPHEPGLLPQWLSEKSATDIIVGGMGQRAINLCVQNKINVFVGAPKMEAIELVNKFMKKEISFTFNLCDH